MSFPSPSLSDNTTERSEMLTTSPVLSALDLATSASVSSTRVSSHVSFVLPAQNGMPDLCEGASRLILHRIKTPAKQRHELGSDTMAVPVRRSVRHDVGAYTPTHDQQVLESTSYAYTPNKALNGSHFTKGFQETTPQSTTTSRDIKRMKPKTPLAEFRGNTLARTPPPMAMSQHALRAFNPSPSSSQKSTPCRSTLHHVSAPSPRDKTKENTQPLRFHRSPNTTPVSKEVTFEQQKFTPVVRRTTRRLTQTPGAIRRHLPTVAPTE